MSPEVDTAVSGEEQRTQLDDPTAIAIEPGGAEQAAGPAEAAGEAKTSDRGKKRARKAKKKDAAQPLDAGSGIHLVAHPRAARRVAEAKAWGGLAGFALGGYLSLPTHTLADAAVRALLAGIICRTAVWAAAIFVWRRIVVAELRHAQLELLAARRPELEAPTPTAEK